MSKIHYTICPVLGYGSDMERIIDCEEWADNQTFNDKAEAYDYMYDNNLQEDWAVIEWEEC